MAEAPTPAMGTANLLSTYSQITIQLYAGVVLAALLVYDAS